MSANDLIQIGSHDRLTRRMVVTAVANGGLLLGQSRDDEHDDHWLDAAKVLAQLSIAGSIDLDNFGQARLVEVYVCGCTWKVTHIWTKWRDKDNRRPKTVGSV